VVVRAAVILVARAHRRHRRLDVRRRRQRRHRDPRHHLQGPHPGRRVAAGREPRRGDRRLRGLPAHICAAAIALGTYSGGWRIIQTLGTKVVEVRPPQGFGSEAAAATVILASSHAGYPLSTTQVVSGAVTGSGVGRPGARVNWVVARRIVYGWLFTLPAAAAVGGLVYGVIDLLGGGVVGVIAIAVIGVICAFSLWRANKAKAVDPEETISENPAFGPAAAVEVAA
jgi:hypothetical protein